MFSTVLQRHFLFVLFMIMHCLGSCSKKCHGLEETKTLVEGKLAIFFHLQYQEKLDKGTSVWAKLAGKCKRSINYW